MEIIFHEKQEGSLCAQHCLNSLLQSEYFTAVDLATFANDLDEAEQHEMNSSSTVDQRPLQGAVRSSNMDDTGFFSIQVIAKALQVWGLEMVPYLHPSASETRQHPADEKAFICNMQHHWFTVRKLGRQWFNLNSLNECPDLISDTYLHLFLDQLQLEGHTVFVVRGELPECEAENYLLLNPVSASQHHVTPHPVVSSDEDAIEQRMLEAALEMSLQS